MAKKNKREDDPDLAAWRRRHELRRSNAAQPIPNAREKGRRRDEKHKNRRYED